VSSALDILSLAKYLYDFRPDILALTRTVSMSVATTTSHGMHDFVSIHPFISDPRFIGGKTGRTIAAGETMLTILRISDHPIAFIVLGSDFGARENDTRLLLNSVSI
jgi:D-alanyl-D-alanine carboxypeptidase